MQLHAFGIPPIKQLADRFRVRLPKDQRQKDAGVDDYPRGYEARCSSSPLASRTKAAASTTSG